jgi:Toastrack DUF4097
MTVSYRIAARAALLAIFVAAASATAQTGQDGTAGSWFDSLSGMLGDVGGYLGEKTEQVLAPRFPRLGDVQAGRLQGLVQRSRTFHESYPVPPGCLVSVSNEFGEIRVQTWDNPRVQVHAEITAGAESGDVALELADTTVIEVLRSEESIAIRTIKQDTRDLGIIAIDVNYVITVPRDASALCENYFGDTIVHGLGGSVTVKSEFGAVDLRNIGGPVKAQARGGGEFAFLADGLRQGGRFDLRRTESEFANVAGDLWIENNMGTVKIRNMAPESDLDVFSYSGPVYLFLGQDSEPDIGAIMNFGLIKSDIPLSRSSLGENRVAARSANVESRQRVTANVSYADFHIIQEGARPLSPVEAVQEGDAQVVTEPVEPLELDVPEDIEIVVDATVGNIVIEGIDEARLYVEAKKLVVLRTNATAKAALEALPFTVERLDGQVRIRTSADNSIGSLGCTRYRTDLTIRCPRTASLRVTAANGHTTVNGTGGAVAVTQKTGRISVEHAKGPLALTNEKGGVYVAHCAGPVELSLNSGNAETHNVYGKQTVYCVDGKAVIDEPGGDVTVRSHGGDARIMALPGVAGDYDVKVEDGNLSILLSQSSNDAELSVTARNGTVYPAIRLFNGQMEKGVVTYSGGVVGGAHTVTLETKNGNIVID